MHLAIDLGTSSVKLLAARPDGTIVGEHEEPLPLATPRPGWAEADPDAWSAAVGRGLDALGRDWTGIAVTGQMHGTVLVGPDGAPVRPAVLWPDTRAVDEQALWDAAPDGARLGGPFSPGMTGPVLAWLARYEPSALAAATRVLLPKDVVRGRLTGEHGTTDHGTTDRSDAAGTLLWDVVAEHWSPSVPAAAGFSPALLPAVVRSDSPAGRYRGADVVTGGGDTAVSLLAVERAVGGWRSNDRVVNVGSGAQVIDPLVPPPGDHPDPALHIYADCRDGHYAMVAVVNAGLAVAAARRTLGLDWDAYRDLVTATRPGAGGTLFVPDLATERGAMRPRRDGPSGATWWRADGLPGRARAVAESQAFLIRRADELLGPSSGRVIAVGGGVRDPWAGRLLADVLGRDVLRLDVRSAAALGALCLSAGPTFRVHAPAVHHVARRSDALDDAYARWSTAAYA